MRLRRPPIRRGLGRYRSRCGSVGPKSLRHGLLPRPSLRLRWPRLDLRPGILGLREGCGVGSACLWRGGRCRVWPRHLRLLCGGRRPRDIERIGCSACGTSGREAEISGIARRHGRDFGHGLRLKFHDACFELGVDPPEERANIEIEQGAIGIDHPAGLGPRRQRIEHALLEGLHNLGSGPDPRCEVCFGEGSGGPQVPKQLRHFSIIAGGHCLDPVNRQVPLRGNRL
jgi:hypothetical protein